MTKIKTATQGVYLLYIAAGVVLISSLQAAYAQSKVTEKNAPARVSDARALELSLMNKARRATSDSHYEAACEYLADVLTANPKNAEAHYLLGLLQGRQGKFSESIDHERKCLKLMPNYAAAHSVLGRSLAGKQNYQAAVEELKEAVRLDPRSPISYVNLAAVKGMQGDYKGALDAYDNAIRVDPKYTQAYLGKALAYAKLKDTKGQLEACRSAVRVAPTSSVAHGRLGFALSQSGDVPGAMAAGLKANLLRVNESWNEFLGMFLTAWASVFLVFAAIFAALFAGSRFKPQEGEVVLKSFFLTFYKDKPGRFVVTDTRIVFVPEAFSAWFGATRVSIQRPQIEAINYLSTVGGGTVSILTRDQSVHQFRMPLLVLDPVRSLLVSQGLTAPEPEAKTPEPAAPQPDRVEASKVEEITNEESKSDEKKE
ncbi:tetratricopeptide repeat protein [bacterium]|nr:tetratricopeptide repeat protein [bacterium]MBP9810722.1 tetratricopeptide repeat protein [bacterium]